LNVNLDEKINVKILIGDKNFNCERSGLFQKALYGLKHAGRQCYYKISGFL